MNQRFDEPRSRPVRSDTGDLGPGCFAAPIFNVLCGFGLSLLIETLKSYPEPFTEDLRIDPLLANALVCQAAVLLLLLAAAAATRFTLGRAVAATLVAVYVCFLVLCLLIGFGAIG